MIVSVDHPYLATIDGVQFSKPDKRLICYPYAFTADSYVIPDGIQTIGEYAFYSCDSLTSIMIPNSVTRIENDAFSDCKSLTSITIPDSVTSIGEYAFYSCDSLTSVAIPDSVISIGANPFISCDKLANIIVSVDHPYLATINGALFSKPDKRLVCYPCTFAADPGSLSRFVEMFRCIIVNSLILRFAGSNGLSSFAASNSVMAVFWTIPFGMMAVDRMLLSISVGEEDRKATVDIMRVICRWGVLLVACAAVSVCLAAEPLTRLFFRDPADPVYGMTVMGLRILPFCMLFSVVNHGFFCYYQIMEKRAFSTVLAVLNGAVFVVACSWLLMPSMQMNGLYLANIINGAGCLLTIILYAAAQIRRLPRNLTDLLAFPDGFGVDDDDFLEFSVSDPEAVLSIALRVEQFCLGKGIDRRRAVFSGLALEESAGNVMEHASQEVQPKRRLDIRVAVKDGGVTLRLKDNCPPFTPSEQMEITNPQDGIQNIGLRILSGSAAEFQY